MLRPIAEKWKLIGTELKVDPSVLAMIESEHDTDVKKLFQMLEVESQKVLNKQILYEAVSSPQVMEQEIAKKVLSPKFVRRKGYQENSVKLFENMWHNSPIMFDTNFRHA